jgi:hypothetical protein
MGRSRSQFSTPGQHNKSYDKYSTRTVAAAAEDWDAMVGPPVEIAAGSTFGLSGRPTETVPVEQGALMWVKAVDKR